MSRMFCLGMDGLLRCRLSVSRDCRFVDRVGHPQAGVFACGRVQQTTVDGVGGRLDRDGVGDRTAAGRSASSRRRSEPFAPHLHAASKLPVLRVADSDRVQLAEEVRAVGFPLSDILGETVKITRGSIAGIVNHDDISLFQIDATINPGNSGGPLMNNRGEVVGVNSSALFGEAVAEVGFATPTKELRGFTKRERNRALDQAAQFAIQRIRSRSGGAS
jgi:hypothetical protein